MKKLTISSGVFGSSALNLSACFVRAHWPKVSSRYFIIFSDSTKTENMVEIIILHGVIRTARTSMKLHARPSSDFNFNQTFISPSSINSKIGTFLSTFKSDIQIGLFERLMLMVSCALKALKFLRNEIIWYHYVMNMSWLHNNDVLNEFLCHTYKEPILRVWQMDKIDFHKVF